MADSRQFTFRFTCPECFVGLKASVGNVGSRLMCPSCQANIVVPEAPKDSNPAGPVEEHEGYDLRPDDVGPDDREYVTVLCSLCHTRMYAPEDEIGRKMTCPDCGTRTTVARIVEFAPQEEAATPIEFDGSTEYAVRDEDYRPPADYREANRLQIPVVCPLCKTRMHAEESQVGSTIVCPDCQTETLVPAAPDRQPDLEQQDVGEYGVGKPSEVFYPKFAKILDNPIDEPDPPPDDGPRPAGTAKARKPSESRPTRTAKARKPSESPRVRTPKDSKPTDGREDAAEADSSEEKIIRRPGKPPAFWRMFAFLFYPSVCVRWLSLALGAVVVAVIPMLAVDLAGGPNGPPIGVFVELGVEMAQLFGLALGVFWACLAGPACLNILEETAAGTDAIDEWPDFGSILSLQNALAVSALSYSAVTGHLIGQIPRIVGTPDWLGTPVGVFFLFPIVLLALLERGSLFNLCSVKIARSLISHCWAWLLFYLQSFLLLAALLLVVMPSSEALGSWSALIAGPWFTAIVMVYFRLLGRLAWHVSGERVPEEPIDPPDLSKLIERGEAEEIC